MDILLRNIIRLEIKLGEARSFMSSMHQRMREAHQGEAQAISNAKAEIIKLEKSF